MEIILPVAAFVILGLILAISREQYNDSPTYYNGVYGPDGFNNIEVDENGWPKE